MAKRYYVAFAGDNPKGGMQDYLGAGYSQDEVQALVAAAHPAWWQIAVFHDDGLHVVATGPEKGKKGDDGK